MARIIPTTRYAKYKVTWRARAVHSGGKSQISNKLERRAESEVEGYSVTCPLKRQTIFSWGEFPRRPRLEIREAGDYGIQ